MKLNNWAKPLRLAVMMGTMGLSTPGLAEEASGGMGSSDQGAPAANAEEAQNDESLKTARLHFNNGVDLLKESPPNYQDAFYQFQLAHKLSGESWQVLGNLGYCALKLERDAEAALYYKEYLEKGGDQVDPEERKSIEQELLLLEGNMVHLTIESSDPDVTIEVRREGSSAPTQAYETDGGAATLGLRAGSLTVTAQSGNRSLAWTQVFKPGQAASHQFDFEAAEPDASPPQRVEVQERPRNPVRTTGWVLTGTSLVTLGAAVIFGARSQSKERNATEDCINNVCPGDAENDANAARNLAKAANVLYITSGVLAATGISLVVVGKPKAKKEHAIFRPRVEITPAPTSGGAALIARGTF